MGRLAGAQRRSTKGGDMTTRCMQRIGWRNDGQPIICRNEATISLTNQQGITRDYCDACFKNYRDSFKMLGPEAVAIFDQQYRKEALSLRIERR